MAQPGPSAPQDVIRVSKKFLPGMAIGYSSSKLTLHVGDGFEFMKQNQDAFDVIITDSSDPMGKQGLALGHLCPWPDLQNRGWGVPRTRAELFPSLLSLKHDPVE